MIYQVIKNNKKIRFETSMLGSYLCEYSHAYIVAKGIISVRGTNDANIRNKKLVFKNNAPFRSCITKIKTHCRKCIRS